MGKPIAPVKRKEEFKSPISKGWISTSRHARHRSCSSSLSKTVMAASACSHLSALASM